MSSLHIPASLDSFQTCFINTWVDHTLSKELYESGLDQGERVGDELVQPVI